MTITVNFVCRESQCFPRQSREALSFEGNKIHQSVGDCYKAKQSKTKADFGKRQHQATFNCNCTLWSRATAVNISRVTVNCFPFDVIDFMLPVHGTWREPVSLLDVMWPWTSQWMGGKNTSYITMIFINDLHFWILGRVAQVQKPELVNIECVCSSQFFFAKIKQ